MKSKEKPFQVKASIGEYNNEQKDYYTAFYEERKKLKSNPYINSILEIHDFLYDGFSHLYTKKELKEELNWYERIFKMKEYDTIDKRIVKAEVMKEEFLAGFDFRTVGFSYHRLVDFCNFIRFSEKAFFYNNKVAPNKIFVDNKFDLESNNCSFSLSIDRNGENVAEIHFKLEDIEETISSEDKEKRTHIYSIQITVNHLEGKKLQNRFIVINNEIVYNELSDILLISKIEDELFYRMKLAYKSIFTLVMEKAIREYDKRGKTRYYL